MKRIIITGSLTLCLLVTLGGEGVAFNSIGNNWAAEYPGACQTLQDARLSAQSCVLCHTPGFGFNAYGADLEANGANFAAVANMDSDGDGRTNVQEILEDCTLPGDGTSVPVDADSWAAVKSLYR